MHRATLNTLAAGVVPRERRRWPALLLLLCATVSASAPGADEVPTEWHYAVIGAVQQPQALTLAAPSVRLDELLEAAGGLSPAADGTVRIIHPAHGDERLFSGVAGSELVPDGAVIVAVSASNAAHRDQRSSTGCYVACINLWDRPVICRLPGDASTLESLARVLGLPADVIHTAKVIVSNPGHDGAELAAGTVIDFAGVAIDRQQLGEAPHGTQATDERDAENVDRDSDVTSTADPATPNLAGTSSPNAPLAVSASFAATNDVTSGEITGLFGGAPDEPQEMRDVPAPVVEAALIEEPADRVTRAIAAAESPEIPLPPQTSEQNLKLNTRESAPPVPAVQETRVKSADRPKQRSTPALSWIPAVAISFFALGGLALAIAWSHRERHRRRTLFLSDETPVAAPQQRASDSVLQELINDTLPVLIEEPWFPEQARMYGRVVGFRHLILHYPHQSRGPHLLRRRPGDGALRTSGQMQAIGVRERQITPRPDIVTVPTERDVPATATPLERALWMHRTGGDA